MARFGAAPYRRFQLYATFPVFGEVNMKYPMAPIWHGAPNRANRNLQDYCPTDVQTDPLPFARTIVVRFVVEWIKDG